jgi:hypothetical protein
MKKKIISILLAITFVLSFAIVPSMAEGPLSVELLADKTNFVTSTDEQIVTISVILKNPAPTESKIAGVNFDLKTSDSNLQVSANEADIEKTDKFSNATFISNKFTGLNMDSSFYAVAIADTQITLLQFKVIIAANCPEGTYQVYTEDLVLSDVNSNSVYENNASISLTITTPHVHQWAANWTSDGTHHWHECTAEGCTLTAGTANSEKGGYEEHNWTAANCTTAKTCSICGKTEGSALGHDWADATCTAPKTCKRTGCTATDGSPLGHDWATDWTIGDVQHWHKCNRTGCTVINAAANHIPDRNAATEDDPVKCTECGKVLTPALGHVHTSHLTSVAAKAPTCTAPGNAAYWKCSCDKLFSDDTATTETTLAAVTKAALGHDHNGPWVTTDENEHWKVCAREGCNEQLDKAVHTPSAWVNVGDGYHHQTCTVCERELTHEVCTFGQPLKYNATSHWEECTKCGNKQNEAAHEFLPDSDKCTGCDYTKSSTITIITPTQPGDSKPAEGNPSTGAVSGPVGYIAIGLAVVGALCLGAKKLTKKHED